jgi:hypothetical protein
MGKETRRLAVKNMGSQLKFKKKILSPAHSIHLLLLFVLIRILRENAVKYDLLL